MWPAKKQIPPISQLSFSPPVDRWRCTQLMVCIFCLHVDGGDPSPKWTRTGLVVIAKYRILRLTATIPASILLAAMLQQIWPCHPQNVTEKTVARQLGFLVRPFFCQLTPAHQPLDQTLQ